MSEQEFDNYLALLSRLLRIAPQQREQVAEEFRTHLEDRLDDLLARGISRDKAVKLALEEFGDAAALAAELAQISAIRKRRWYMKASAFTVVGLAAAVLLAIALWPESERLPGTPQAIAQQPATKGKGKLKAAAPQKTLEQKLAERTTVEFLDTPLTDVFEFVGSKNQIQIYTNRRALSDESIMLDAPITMSLADVKVETVLDLAMEQVSDQLAYLERDGVLIISTVTALEGATEVRVYNCRDLLALTTQPSGMMPGPMGMGSMEMGPGGMMRGMPGIPSPGPGAGGGLAPAAPGDHPGVRRIEPGTNQPSLNLPSRAPADPAGGAADAGPTTDISPELPRNPAADLPDLFRSSTPLPDDLPASGTPSTPPSSNPADPAGDAAPTSDNADPFGAPPRAGSADPFGAPPPDSRTSVHRWNDRAILAQIGGGGFGAAGGMMPGMGGMGGGMGPRSRPAPTTDHERKAARLMDLIITAVEPNSWQDTGGFGTISEYEGLIVVNHNPRTHKKIENVLSMLRQSAGLPENGVMPGGSMMMGGMESGMMGGFGGPAGGGAAPSGIPTLTPNSSP